MIVSKISDGLGNQLFMYACGYAAARRLNTGLILDTMVLETNKSRKNEIKKLNIVYDDWITVEHEGLKLRKVFLRFWKKKKLERVYTFFGEKTPYHYDERVLLITDNTYLEGYWQTEKYFSDYRDELVKLFKPNYAQSIKAKEYISQVESCNSVAIHIRRGDYNSIGICLKEAYYHDAIFKMNNSIENPVFYVFSDDMDAAKEILNQEDCNFVYVQYESDNLTLDDFFIMKACKHQIIANSSFSWWTAWLNENAEKIVICPEYRQWAGDFYPEEWIKISCN